MTALFVSLHEQACARGIFRLGDISPALETDTCIRATMRVEKLRECVMLDRVTEGGGRIYRRERGGGKRSSSIGFRCDLNIDVETH